MTSSHETTNVFEPNIIVRHIYLQKSSTALSRATMAKYLLTRHGPDSIIVIPT
jgi:hypothetical protein